MNRKKTCVCIFLVGLWITNPLGAAVGVKAGIGWSGLLSTAEGFKHYLGYEVGGLSGKVLLGYQAGFFTTFNLSRKLQVQPEIFYALRGFDGSTTYLYDDIVYKIKIPYIELPLLLKFRIWTRKAFSAAIFTGFYTAMKLKAEKQSRIWKVEEKTSLENVKKFDYGLMLGFCGEADSGRGRVLLELRSGFGLKNVMEAPPGTIRLRPGDVRMRNVYVSILIGYGYEHESHHDTNL